MTAGMPSAMHLIRGHVVSFCQDPRKTSKQAAVRTFEDGAVLLDKHGDITWVGDYGQHPAQSEHLAEDDYRGYLVLPGLIDTHIHFPQYRMLAAPGEDLLDWLNRFTFVEEALYSDHPHAEAAAERFLSMLFSHGTTAALAFSSVHPVAAEALFSAGMAKDMALITGKTMMDRNAPEVVCDTAEQSAIDSQLLIEKWHGIGRLRYAITPRFAITSTREQLSLAGELARNNPDCLIHTHLSESAAEIELVATLFPEAKDYCDVYDKTGLIGPNSIFAHAIHLNTREQSLLSQAGASVIHCPTSNMFLGSGLLDIENISNSANPVPVGIATDVGGGTSYSMLQTLGAAYKVAQLNGRRFSAHDGFYMATLGNAQRIGLGDQIGSLDPGKAGDMIIVDPCPTPLLAERQTLSESLEDTLFSLMMLGDDRAIKATYIRGKKVYCQTGL